MSAVETPGSPKGSKESSGFILSSSGTGSDLELHMCSALAPCKPLCQTPCSERDTPHLMPPGLSFPLCKMGGWSNSLDWFCYKPLKSLSSPKLHVLHGAWAASERPYTERVDAKLHSESCAEISGYSLVNLIVFDLDYFFGCYNIFDSWA